MTKNISAAAFGLAITIVPGSIFAQGALTPTGAPAATMRSLDQIEPRTPISSLPFTISSSGSYFLTKNLSVASANGITINATNVDLDLRGFTISSTVGSGTSAIALGSLVDNVTIKNGRISGGTGYNGSTFSGGGFAIGIDCSGSFHHNIHVSYVSILGVSTIGTNSGVSSADHCHVSVSAGDGLVAGTVSDSAVDTINNGNAILAQTVMNCSGQGINANGINATNVMNSLGTSTGGVGIIGVNVSNSSATSTNWIGMQATNVTNSTGTTTGGPQAIIANSVSFSRGVANGSGTGIQASLVIGCTAGSTSGTAVVGTKYLMP